MPKLLKLKSNYKTIAKQLLGKEIADGFCKKTVGKDGLTAKEIEIDIINRDLPRTSFLSRSHDINAIQEKWLQDDTDNTYVQGNIDARVFAGSFHTIKNIETSTLAHDQERKQDILTSGKSMGFGFIDKDGIDCGFSLNYSDIEPGFFTITIIKNSRKSPEDREVTLYQGSGGPIYPELENLISENTYKVGYLIDQSTLKQELLGDDSLPDEVKYLISDVINDNGKVNVEQFQRIYNDLEIGSTNNNLIFNVEIEIQEAKSDLQIYKRFCTDAIKNLNTVGGSEQANAKALIVNISKTLDKITSNLDLNEGNVQTGDNSLINMNAVIQSEVLVHLQNSSLNKPYQDTIGKMQEHCENVKSLAQQRTTSFKTSSALSILAVTGAALVATGLIANPIGLAVVAAVSITLGISSLISWGKTAYKQHKYSKAIGKLEQNLKQEIQSLKKEGGDTKILELYQEKDTPEAAQGKDTSVSFKENKSLFHKAIKDFNKSKEVSSDEQQYEKASSP